MEKHQTPLSDDTPGSVPALELISRAVSSVGVMYHSHGPNTGSTPGRGQKPKKTKEKWVPGIFKNLRINQFKLKNQCLSF